MKNKKNKSYSIWVNLDEIQIAKIDDLVAKSEFGSRNKFAEHAVLAQIDSGKHDYDIIEVKIIKKPGHVLVQSKNYEAKAKMTWPAIVKLNELIKKKEGSKKILHVIDNELALCLTEN